MTRFGIATARDVTDHQIIEQGPQVVLEQHSFEWIDREFLTSLSEELIQVPFELRDIRRFVPIRRASPTEELDPVPSFNPRDGWSTSYRREPAGTNGHGREESIPKVLWIGVEQWQRVVRAERSGQLPGVVVGRILFLEVSCQDRGGRQYSQQRPEDENQRR